MPQVRHLVVPAGTGVRRQVGRNQRQVECAVAAELRRGSHHTWPAGKPAGLLGARPQVRSRCGRQPAVQLVEAASGTHCGHRSGQSPPRRSGVVDAVGADRLDACPHSKLAQRVVALAVERVAVVPQLDEHVPATCRVNEQIELCSRRAWSPGSQRSADGALAMPGQDHPLVTMLGHRSQELVGSKARRVLSARHLGC